MQFKSKLALFFLIIMAMVIISTIGYTQWMPYIGFSPYSYNLYNPYTFGNPYGYSWGQPYRYTPYQPYSDAYGWGQPYGYNWYQPYFSQPSFVSVVPASSPPTYNADRSGIDAPLYSLWWPWNP